MAYKRKTEDEFRVLGRYYGRWEVETVETSYSDAKAQVKAYRENVPGVAFKIQVKRVRIEAETINAATNVRNT